MKLITETYNEPLSLLNEADESGKKHLYIQGPFAVSEVKNKNGRMYSRALLEKVIDKYTKDYIKPSRALGEMNHPCFKPGANVFVQNKGLIPIEDVQVGDYVYGTTLENSSVPTRVTATTKNKFVGNLIRFESRAFNAIVTPYHRFYIKNYHGEFSVVTAQDIKYDLDNKIGKLSHKYIPRTMENWIGIDKKTIILNKTKDRITHKQDNSYANSPLEIDMKDFCAFMGIYLSEGCVGKYTRLDGTETPGNISIAQNQGVQFDLILDMISRLGVHKYVVRHGEKRASSIEITDIRLADYVNKFGDCYNKYIPSEVLESTKENISEFLTWFHLGDGTNSKQTVNNKEYIQSTLFTVSEKLADGLIECIIKIGNSTIKRVCIDTKDYIFAEHLIEVKNKKPLFRMTVGKHKGKSLDRRALKVTEEYYNGDVYCLVTETENFFVEQNGSVFLSGNCRLSVDFERATHLVTEMVQDANVWIGKAKVLKTPMGKILEGLLESGVAVGVSTRGAGSLVEANGLKTVGDDFMLTAIDAVSDPSGQLIGPDGGMAGCFVQGIMEGVEFFMTQDGKFIQEEIAEQAKKDYDNKRLTEARKLQLFKNFIAQIQGQ